MAFDGTVGLGGNAIFSPSSVKQVNGTNYIPTNDYEDQFLPEVDGSEFERFGPRNKSVTGVLDSISGMMPFASSEYKWEEQNRLHTFYDNVTAVNSTGVFTVRTNIADGGTGGTATAINHVFRVGQTFMAQLGSAAPQKGVITAVSATTFTASAYRTALFSFTAATAIKIFVYGSDFAKGSNGMQGSLEAEPTIYTVKPIIFKGHYKINGSDTAQIGWVQGVTEDGTTGYAWFMKSKSEDMLRWNDYLELGLIDGVPTLAGTGGAEDLTRTTNTNPGVTSGALQGTEGLFYQIEQRGHEFDGFFTGRGVGAATLPLPTGVTTTPEATGANVANTYQYEYDVEDIILALEEQAAIENYMWFVNRQTSLNIDKWLASKNNFGGGSFYGDFANMADKMLNLGFKGFEWGGYSFAKMDWRYLNDPTLRGSITDIKGVMLPSGTSTNYDTNLGKNATTPFVSIGYRTSETDNRMNKEWITGSVGGAYTDDEDALKCHFLSERLIAVKGANNMILLK